MHGALRWARACACMRACDFCVLPPSPSGSNKLLVSGLRCLTCGCRPLESFTTIIVSTHRVFGYTYNDNTCSIGACRPNKKSESAFWMPLSGLKGYRVGGSMTTTQNCCTKFCLPFPCFSPTQVTRPRARTPDLAARALPPPQLTRVSRRPPPPLHNLRVKPGV
jgi:hypothetical protein